MSAASATCVLVCLSVLFSAHLLARQVTSPVTAYVMENAAYCCCKHMSHVVTHCCYTRPSDSLAFLLLLWVLMLLLMLLTLCRAALMGRSVAWCLVLCRHWGRALRQTPVVQSLRCGGVGGAGWWADGWVSE